MNKIINWGKTKELARELPKYMEEHEYGKVGEHYLMYLKSKGIFWEKGFLDKDILRYSKKIPIQKKDLYVNVGLGKYKRKRLSLIDDYLCHKINTLNYVGNHKKVNKTKGLSLEGNSMYKSMEGKKKKTRLED